MARLLRPAEHIYDTVIGDYTIASRTQQDGTVDVPVQPVIVVDEQELLIFHSGGITALGATTIWTPTTGKRARVRGFSVIVDPATTTVAGSLISLLDGGAAVDDFLFIGVGPQTQTPLRWQAPLPGNGLRSAAVNNVIAVNLSAALTAGGIYINVWGTEE